MQALARRHGARVRFDGGETQGHVEARPATPFSVMQEWADLGFALTRAALRAQLGPNSRPSHAQPSVLICNVHVIKIRFSCALSHTRVR